MTTNKQEKQMTTNKQEKYDGYLDEVLKVLFGSTHQFKVLTGEEQKILSSFGYKPTHWDLLLQKGELTKEDVQKRVDLFRQLEQLDWEVEQRRSNKKVEPKFKKGDAVQTHQWGNILIFDVHQEQDQISYWVFDMNGHQRKLTEQQLVNCNVLS